LEKQLNDEIAMYQDLQEKYNKSIERRDELKGQLEDSQEQFGKVQSAYNELSKKWKDKSELIDELDIKVRQMKDNYDHKEKGLIEEKTKLAEENR
jgi:leucine-rich repeat/coiled-coil domain-containing protein 1